METISKSHFTLKRISEDNWEQFLSNHQSEIGFSAAYNVWKVMNCREPEGLGYAAYACSEHPVSNYTHPQNMQKSLLPHLRQGSSRQVGSRYESISQLPLFPHHLYGSPLISNIAF